MEEVTLTLDGKRCRILIGHDILQGVGGLMPTEECRRHAIITNPAVRALYGGTVSRSMAEVGLDHDFLEIADSEASKSLECAETQYGRLSAERFGRDSCIVGLGGGVVGDLAGFIAATYMRGIDLIQVPTTLVAQADSAIGGKAGLNLPGGKNLVGAFHQPIMVISDVGALRSLPDSEYRSGLAEVLKYGMACDAGFFGWLESNIEQMKARNGDALVRAVADCSRIKARIVERDELDLGERQILNYGHTLGHALETATGYSRYRHGEAAAIGMMFAARISARLGLLAETDLERLHGLMRALCLPTGIEGHFEPEKLMDFMGADKKARRGKTRLVLPTGIGKAIISDGADRELIMKTLEGMKA